MVSETQLEVLAIMPKITASLSIPCSCFIASFVWLKNRTNKRIPIQRALMGMSVIDVVASSGWWLSTWAVPRDSEVPAAFAAGNTASCVYQGTLLQIAIGAPLYNASLALYYLLVIKFGWTDDDLLKIEPYVHGTILTFTFGTGIGLIPLNVYNHIGTVCWIIGKPQQCGNSSFGYNPDVPCERGNRAWIYGLFLFYVPLWICILFSIVAMVLIYGKVRQVARLNAVGTTARGVDPTRIAVQAMLYTGAFFITWSPSTIWSIATWFHFGSFWLGLASAVCEPLQGFWNLLVFIRHRPNLQLKVGAMVRSKLQCCCHCRSREASTPYYYSSSGDNESRRSSLFRMSQFLSRQSAASEDGGEAADAKEERLQEIREETEANVDRSENVTHSPEPTMNEDDDEGNEKEDDSHQDDEDDGDDGTCRLYATVHPV